jgi:parallel beta-helix repeat protein
MKMAYKDWNDVPYVNGDCIRDEAEWNDMVTCVRNKAYDYIIYKDNGTYRALNGTTGNIDSSNIDASTVIQYAINALISGGDIHIKNGIYEIATKLSPINDMKITGGGNTVLKAIAVSGNDIIEINGKHDVYIGYLILDGNATVLGGAHINLQSKNTSYNTVFDHVESYDAGADGMGVWQSSYNCEIKNCKAHDNGTNGIFIEGAGGSESHRNKVIDCYSYLNGVDGIRVTDTYDNIIIGNHLRANSTNGITVSAAHRNIIMGNYIHDHAFYDGIGIGSGNNNVIIGNILENNGEAEILCCGNDTIISHNRTMGNRGIWINSGNRNIVTGNIVRDNAVAAIIDTGTATVINDNSGYVTENHGVSGVIADGGVIAHGCAVTPISARLSGSVAGEIITVTAIGAANITVAIKNNAGAAGTPQIIYWEALV